MTNLEEVLAALKGATEIELSVKGRVSGKVSARPVWFVLGKDNRSIALIPVNGRNTQWYLNALKDPNVSVRVAGYSFPGRIREVNEERLTGVLEMFTAKYGKRNMEMYYPSKEVAVELPLTS